MIIMIMMMMIIIIIIITVNAKHEYYLCGDNGIATTVSNNRKHWKKVKWGLSFAEVFRNQWHINNVINKRLLK